MTVQEMLDEIEDLRQQQGDGILDLEVAVEYDYNDHAHTRALTFFECAFVAKPVRSLYSDSGLRVPKMEKDEYNEIIEEPSDRPKHLILGQDCYNDE